MRWTFCLACCGGQGKKWVHTSSKQLTQSNKSVWLYGKRRTRSKIEHRLHWYQSILCFCPWGLICLGVYTVECIHSRLCAYSRLPPWFCVAGACWTERPPVCLPLKAVLVCGCKKAISIARFCRLSQATALLCPAWHGALSRTELVQRRIGLAKAWCCAVFLMPMQRPQLSAAYRGGNHDPPRPHNQPLFTSRFDTRAASYQCQHWGGAAAILEDVSSWN